MNILKSDLIFLWNGVLGIVIAILIEKKRPPEGPQIFLVLIGLSDGTSACRTIFI